MDIPFSRPSLNFEEEKAVKEVLRSGWLAAGPQVSLFEQEFTDYVGAKYAIFTNSGTSALKMAYKYYKEERGVKGIWSPRNTFCATYSAAQEVGLEVNFYDDPPEIKKKSSEIVVAVHYGGVKSDIPCQVEDSAHRIEANDPLIGDIRCYSFYATKNMTTGSGGMLVTNDPKIYERIRLYWRDGLSATTLDRSKGVYDSQVLAMAGGYDGNDLAAAIGRVQLKKLPKFTTKRNDLVDRYNRQLNGNWQGNHFYSYPVKDYLKLIAYLRENGVIAAYHYPFGKPNALSLPVYPLLTLKEVDYICDLVQGYNRIK